MKRVLIIIGSLRIGGAERIARDIGIAADPEEFEIHYLVHGDEIGDYEEELIHNGCRIHHLPQPETNYRKYVRDLYLLLKKNRFSVIHAHTMHNSGWAVFCGRFLGVKRIIVHSHSFRGNQTISLKQRMYQAVMRFIIQSFATNWIACGKLAGEWLYGKRFFQKNGQVILNGIDTKRFRFSEENRNEIREKLNLGMAHVIGHVGHLLDVKNQAFLIHLMPELIRRRETRLLLIGNGENWDKLHRSAETAGVSSQVIFLGNVSNVEACLSAVDVFAFPSLFEGTPLAVLEAQASGLHCVISEYVPDDVAQTDLIEKLPLKEAESRWLYALGADYDIDRESYAGILCSKGLDTVTMTERIVSLYRSN